MLKVSGKHSWQRLANPRRALAKSRCGSGVRLIYRLNENKADVISIGSQSDLPTGPSTLDALDAMLARTPKVKSFWLEGEGLFRRKDLLDISDVIAQSASPERLFILTDGIDVRQILDFCRNRSLKIPLHLVLGIADGGRSLKHRRVFALRECSIVAIAF